MGCYVNPQGQTKEQWLFVNGTKTDGPMPITETHLPVVWVHNGMFTAAGVGFSQDEVRAFSQPDDTRPKQWFYVERTKLREVSDLANYE